MIPQPCPSQAYIYNGVVTRVIDGDTVEIEVDLGFHLKTTQRFRLVDINAPEMKGAMRLEGLAARTHVLACLAGEKVVIRTTKSDDFGRWLVRIWFDPFKNGSPMVDFNADMVAAGFAVPYREGEGGA